MTHTESAETRTLTIVLPESEWRALRAEEPDAVAWLHSQIRARLGTPAAPPNPPADAFSLYDVFDDY